MKEMFQRIAEKIAAGESLVMVTVIAASGATPRGAGARMLVGKEGRICGTIGGGAVEYRSQQIAQQVLESGSSRAQDFSLTRDDVQNLGMICGGDVHVFFSFLQGSDQEVLDLAQKAEQYFVQGKNLWLILDISQDGKMGLYTQEEGFFGMEDPHWHPEQTERQAKRICVGMRELFAEQINSSSKVYIFGGGHVSQQLVPVLSRVGFRCVVLEDRPEFADPALFPTASEVLLVDFDRIDQWITVDKNDYACVMTRGHAHDTVIQAQLLRTPACYIGVIGSAAKKAQVYQKLYEQGFTPDDTARITSPIGLPILAETPEEIAVSIAAQMILQRAKLRA